MIKLMLTLSFMLLASYTNAEQVIETDQYLIHYNAFNSTAIDADAAQKNQLIRSKVSAMINIAVLKKDDEGNRSAQRSINTGTVENLVGQQQVLNFVTIDEGKALYYIASFRFADEQQMKFNISVQPDPNAEPIKLTFSQKFYVD
ncbi:DUF4426 domain-containing protein [Gammaproteobacteria bacterium AS21]